MGTMPLNEIRVGKRTRKDLGDIDQLAASMDEIGLLHPVVVNGKNKLLAGRRRLAAAKKLGWDTIDVRTVKEKR